MKILVLSLIVLMSFALSACSRDSGDSGDKSNDQKTTLNADPIWKTQTDSLKQAQEVGKLANDMAEKQRKAMAELNDKQ
ncbi:MAG: hypothetical protein GXP19_07130 [Gammaproteobacteria bacterium]|nr:hypothetical protein [Gammaproteobacteria bacterium]